MKNRRSIRLKKYDYSQAGLYFVTICVQNMRCLFGKIINEEWQNLAIKYGHTKSHEYIIMPNHFHAIIEIVRMGSINDTDSDITTGTTVMTVGAGYARPLNVSIRPLNASPHPLTAPFPLNVATDNANNYANDSDFVCANGDGFVDTDGGSLGCADGGGFVDANGDGLGGVGNLGLGGRGQADHAPTAASVVNTVTVGNIVGYFKYQTTKKIDLPVKLWQRNYYEHIIRDEQSYENISKYIVNNPINWQKDKFYGNFKHR